MSAEARLDPRQQIPIYLDQRDGRQFRQLARTVLRNERRRPRLASAELRARWSKPGVHDLVVYADVGSRRLLVRSLTVRVEPRRR
ncbi:MAG TPA: hypothetical protein VMD59_12280 [Acidimicrobiales bacterium]|nr:hypothetical protein [Acidimicrobiales bacterium]